MRAKVCCHLHLSPCCSSALVNDVEVVSVAHVVYLCNGCMSFVSVGMGVQHLLFCVNGRSLEVALGLPHMNRNHVGCLLWRAARAFVVVVRVSSGCDGSFLSRHCIVRSLKGIYLVFGLLGL